MDETSRITTDPDVLGGRPCIRGLRIRVPDILDMLAGGATPAEILEDYPYLEPEDVRAALGYAARFSSPGGGGGRRVAPDGGGHLN